jgi:membrane fusion protein, heavy metal efflux system
MNNSKSIFILLILANLLSNCGTKKIKTADKEPITNTQSNALPFEKAKNIEITMSYIIKKSIAKTIKLNGRIDVPPQNLVSVSVPLGGYLKTTKLLPGMHINKGDVIATIEDQQYVQLQQDYLLTKSKLLLAEQDFARQNELNQSKASSDKIMQIAQYELNVQRIMLKALAEKLKIINLNPTTISAENITRTINIYSKIHGFVSKINVNIGKYVNPTDVLFELIDPLDIHLNVKVFEKDIANIQIGQNIMAYNNVDPTKKYACKVILISQDISPEGVAEVHCHFENYQKNLFPGMYMNAELTLNSEETFAINEDAVVNYEGKNYLFVSQSKGYEMVEVKIGAKENDLIEIQNYPIFANKKIVIKGAYTLLMALKNKDEE